MLTDITSTLLSIGMFSGASAFFIGAMTSTSSFLFLFLFMFLSSFLGILLYHTVIYSICKLAEHFKIIEKCSD
jgi:hypothetical protein